MLHDTPAALSTSSRTMLGVKRGTTVVRRVEGAGPLIRHESLAAPGPLSQSCLIRMANPGLSGLELQQRLKNLG